MAIIKLKQPNGPYKPTIDTDAMNIEIREAYLGVSFVTEQGERLSVSMRDNGFEVHYTGDFGEQGFDAGWTTFNNGSITHESEGK